MGSQKNILKREWLDPVEFFCRPDATENLDLVGDELDDGRGVLNSDLSFGVLVVEKEGLLLLLFLVVAHLSELFRYLGHARAVVGRQQA